MAQILMRVEPGRTRRQLAYEAVIGPSGDAMAVGRWEVGVSQSNEPNSVLFGWCVT